MHRYPEIEGNIKAILNCMDPDQCQQHHRISAQILRQWIKNADFPMMHYDKGRKWRRGKEGESDH